MCFKFIISDTFLIYFSIVIYKVLFVYNTEGHFWISFTLVCINSGQSGRVGSFHRKGVGKFCYQAE